MDIINWIVNYRRFLKRRNYSPHTIKNYMNTLSQFAIWLDVPIEEVTNRKILQYIDSLLDRVLKPKTINSHLDAIRGFYEYLHREEDVPIVNPVKRGYALRLSKPLPKHLKDEEVEQFLEAIKGFRDRAMFMLMLRSGLRVEEVANLTLESIDLKRGNILVQNGKGGKGRIVYVSHDAFRALVAYLKVRPSCAREKKLFLVQKGLYKSKPISVRGIQKRMEYYARKTGLKVTCHRLRHTMATQLLNADTDLVTIQDLLGHSRIRTTERYCKVSNRKVQRDYFEAMEVIMQRTDI
jgi:site-specific recombinase XerD